MLNKEKAKAKIKIDNREGYLIRLFIENKYYTKDRLIDWAIEELLTQIKNKE